MDPCGEVVTFKIIGSQTREGRSSNRLARLFYDPTDFDGCLVEIKDRDTGPPFVTPRNPQLQEMAEASLMLQVQHLYDTFLYTRECAPPFEVYDSAR